LPDELIEALPGSAEPRAAAQMFKKVLKADWPRPARYSQRSSAPGSTHAVKAESEYKVQSDPDNEVPPDMRTRAYMARPAQTSVCIAGCGLMDEIRVRVGSGPRAAPQVARACLPV